MVSTTTPKVFFFSLPRCFYFFFNLKFSSIDMKFNYIQLFESLQLISESFLGFFVLLVHFFRASLLFIFLTLSLEIHGLFHEGLICGDLWNQSLLSKNWNACVLGHWSYLIMPCLVAEKKEMRMENKIIFNLTNEKLDLCILGHWSYLFLTHFGF